MTIQCNGQDIHNEYVEAFSSWCDQYCSRAFAACERGHKESNLHLQGIIRVKTNSVRTVSTQLAAYFKSLEVPDSVDDLPSVCCKTLTGHKLHTFTGMLGYCQKDRKHSPGISEVPEYSDDDVDV